MLSSLAYIYDPLGLIAPLLVQGKLLLQDAVRLKISWNDTLTPVLRQKWEIWVISLKSVSKLTIPRSLIKPYFLMQALNYTVFTTPVNRLMDLASISGAPASRDIYTQLWWPAKYAYVL